MNFSSLCKSLTVILVAISACPLSAQDWIQQMGPDRNGVIPPAVAGPVAESFPDEKVHALWQANTGFGSAPVVVSDGKVYTYGLFKPGTTLEQIADPGSTPRIEDVDAPQQGATPAGTADMTGAAIWAEDHPGYRGDEFAICLDAVTGHMLWATKLTDWGITYKGNILWANLASPLLAKGRLYLQSPEGFLYALDAAKGGIVWRVNLFERQMLEWTDKSANGCGPLLVGDTLIVSYLGQSNPDYSKWDKTIPMIAGFDSATGRTRWITRIPLESFRSMNCRLNFATLDGQPTVLVPCGSGTAGINPATGEILWTFDAKALGSELPFPYPNYAPVVWQNYVVDAVSAAHDDAGSETWCIQITDHHPKLLWSTHDFVPYIEIGKSNLLAVNGRLYGSDSRGGWEGPGGDKAHRVDLPPGRPNRAEGVGQFQCLDIATGKLLWSTDAMKGSDWGSTFSLISGDKLVLINSSGLWVSRLEKEGVTVLLHVPPKNSSKTFSEPVLVGGKLFIREMDANPERGLIGNFDDKGNLLCLQLGGG